MRAPCRAFQSSTTTRCSPPFPSARRSTSSTTRCPLSPRRVGDAPKVYLQSPPSGDFRAMPAGDGARAAEVDHLIPRQPGSRAAGGGRRHCCLLRRRRWAAADAARRPFGDRHCEPGPSPRSPPKRWPGTAPGRSGSSAAGYTVRGRRGAWPPPATGRGLSRPPPRGLARAGGRARLGQRLARAGAALRGRVLRNAGSKIIVEAGDLRPGLHSTCSAPTVRASPRRASAPSPRAPCSATNGSRLHTAASSRRRSRRAPSGASRSPSWGRY